MVEPKPDGVFGLGRTSGNQTPARESLNDISRPEDAVVAKASIHPLVCRRAVFGRAILQATSGIVIVDWRKIQEESDRDNDNGDCDWPFLHAGFLDALLLRALEEGSIRFCARA